MAAARFYSSVAGAMVLQADITSASTTLAVNTTTGLPGTTPFTVVIDPGVSTEEILDVTNVSGVTLTVTRGVDGSSAQSHTAGAQLRHMATARDFRDAQEHIALTAGVHGVAGSVVGTTDSQNLTNKNLNSGTNIFPATLATSATVTAHTGATAAHGATGAVVGTTNTQVLTNKDLTSGTNLFPAALATDAELTAHTSLTAAHGATGAVVGTTNAQALTNKDLTSGTNTFPTSLVTLAGAQALTNKDLSSGTNTFPATMGTTNTVQTLTNKTISGASNTFSAIPQSAVTSLTTSLSGLDTRIGAVETNLGSQTTFAATSSTKDAKALHWGSYTVTTDASGYANVTHGAGFTPTVVVCTSSVTTFVSGQADLTLSVDTFGATTFRVRGVSSNGATLTSTSITFTAFLGE